MILSLISESVESHVEKKKTKKKTSAQKHYIMLIIKLYRINLCKTMSRKDEIFFKHDMPLNIKNIQLN